MLFWSMCIVSLTGLAGNGHGQGPLGLIYASPVPGSEWQSTESRIILRFEGAVPSDLSASLEGTASGRTGFTEYAAADGSTLVLTPEHPFAHGETVTVTVQRTGCSDLPASWDFSVRPLDPPPEAVEPVFSETRGEATMPAPGPAPAVPPLPSGSVALPVDFPLFTFTAYGSPAPGNLFFGPMNPIGGDASYYLVIADTGGQVLFYRHAHTGFYDPEIQADGCLYYICGSLGASGVRWIQLDQSYAKVDSFSVIGYPTDIHGMTIAGNGNVLLIGADKRYIDMSGVVPGGDPDALVQGLLIQEQDRNHMPVFQWSSFDHFEITDACSYVNLTGSFVDYVHCNSIDEDSDGGILVSCLSMSECTKIDRTTGELVWRLGGYQSENPSFALLNDPLGGFSAQHDFRHVSGNLYSVFDNGTQHSPQISRASIYELDTQGMTADLVWNYQLTGMYGSHMGSMQMMQNGNVVVGWGDVTGYQQRPDISEISPSGGMVFTGRLDQIFLESYRSFKFDWIGQAVVPYLVALARPAQSCVQLTYNVFGEDQYASYDIYQGTDPGSLSFLQNTALNQINVWALPTGMNYFRVRARDGQGVPTGFSNMDSAYVSWTGIGEYQTTVPETSAGIGVFPNPAGSSFTVVWPDETGWGAVVELLDCTGRVVARRVLDSGQSARASLEMQTGDLPPGLYLVSVRSGSRSGAARLIILR